MEEALLFIEQNQTWLFLILGAGCALYFWLGLRAYRDVRAALFELERERAITRLTRSGATFALLGSALIAIYLLTTFVSPSIPAAARPTAVPTVSLLATPRPATTADVAEALASPTPLEVASIDGAGCQNPLATILEPASGDTLRGEARFMGVANIPGFAFYKLEYHDLKPGSTWMAISAGNRPVCEEGCGAEQGTEEGELGTWDTSLVTPGQYAVQLVVTDTLGNAPLPCQILVQVVP